MKKYLMGTAKCLALFCSAAAIFTAIFVFASSPAPAPTCQISGVIKSVASREAYDEPCLKNPGGCPTDMATRHPAQYFLDIVIDSVAYVNGETKMMTCEDLFPAGRVATISIDKDKVKAGDVFSAGQKINGTARRFFDLYFDSYSLGPAVAQKPGAGNDAVTDAGANPDPAAKKILEPSAISQKMAGMDNSVQIKDVTLRADGQTYGVAAARSGKILFFIPIRFNFHMTVDAFDATIKEVQKPWWSFLVG